MSKSISLGVIGGGQLGSLLCSAAKKLKVNYNVQRTLSRQGRGGL